MLSIVKQKVLNGGSPVMVTHSTQSQVLASLCLCGFVGRRLCLHSKIQPYFIQVIGQTLHRIRPAIAASRSYSSAAKEVTPFNVSSWAVEFTSSSLATR